MEGEVVDAILDASERKPLCRSLGPIQLTLLGVGSTIGTGIFVLTAEAAQQAGPSMIVHLSSRLLFVALLHSVMRN